MQQITPNKSRAHFDHRTNPPGGHQAYFAHDEREHSYAQDGEGRHSNHSNTNSSSSDLVSRTFSPWRCSSGESASTSNDHVGRTFSLLHPSFETSPQEAKLPSKIPKDDKPNSDLNLPGSAFGPLDLAVIRQGSLGTHSRALLVTTEATRLSEERLHDTNASYVEPVVWYNPIEREDTLDSNVVHSGADLFTPFSAKRSGFFSPTPVRDLPSAASHRSQLESMRMHAHERFGDWVSKSDTNRAQSLNNNKSPFGEVDKLSPFHPSKTMTGGTKTEDVFNTLPAAKAEIGLWPTEDRPLASLPPAYAAANLSSIAGPSQTWASPPEPIDAEYSVFVGDLCPDLREDDLVWQFRRPPAWPPSHPFAIAHAHAQQAQGNFGSPPKIAPAPFLSTKSATIMTDPLTGASRGFGFVRFSTDTDCARALIEMQGIIVQPSSGHGGRPLRVCPATPKNRSSSNISPASSSAQAAFHDRLLNAISVQQRQGHPVDTELLDKLHAQAMATVNSTSASSHARTSSVFSTDSSTSALDPGNTTVFVGGLSSLISEETLKTFFVPFGEIKYVKIPPGKGCGFVQFVKKADAERAIERMQGFPIGGGRIRLSWGRSQGDKAAAAAAQAVHQAAHISQSSGMTDNAQTLSVQQAYDAKSWSGNQHVDIHDPLLLLMGRPSARSATLSEPNIRGESEGEQQALDFAQTFSKLGITSERFTTPVRDTSNLTSTSAPVYSPRSMFTTTQSPYPTARPASPWREHGAGHCSPHISAPDDRPFGSRLAKDDFDVRVSDGFESINQTLPHSMYGPQESRSNIFDNLKMKNTSAVGTPQRPIVVPVGRTEGHLSSPIHQQIKSHGTPHSSVRGFDPFGHEPATFCGHHQAFQPNSHDYHASIVATQPVATGHEWTDQPYKSPSDANPGAIGTGHLESLIETVIHKQR